VREFADLPREARRLVRESRQGLLELIIPNVLAENPKLASKQVAEMISVFFSGICIEANLDPDPARVREKISAFMDVLRRL